MDRTIFIPVVHCFYWKINVLLVEQCIIKKGIDDIFGEGGGGGGGNILRLVECLTDLGSEQGVFNSYTV